MFPVATDSIVFAFFPPWIEQRQNPHAHEEDHASATEFQPERLHAEDPYVFSATHIPEYCPLRLFSLYQKILLFDSNLVYVFLVELPCLLQGGVMYSIDLYRFSTVAFPENSLPTSIPVLE